MCFTAHTLICTAPLRAHKIVAGVGAILNTEIIVVTDGGLTERTVGQRGDSCVNAASRQKIL